MTTFYKATRPNGTDFRTGRILYQVGKRVRPLPSDERYICGPGYLHAATVPAMTLIGGWWPCRLFEVEGKPHVGLDKRHPHKAGFRQLRVVREIPAWQALGPNGEQGATLIERCRTLTCEEARQLGTAWGTTAMGAARGAALGAARDAALGAARDAATDAAWDATWRAGWDATRGAARGAAWGAAWNAARGAVGAVVVRDLITQDQFDTLYGSWASVMEVTA